MLGNEMLLLWQRRNKRSKFLPYVHERKIKRYILNIERRCAHKSGRGPLKLKNLGYFVGVFGDFARFGDEFGRVFGMI